MYVYVACPDPKFGAGEEASAASSSVSQHRHFDTGDPNVFRSFDGFIHRQGDTLPARLDEEWSLQRDDTPELEPPVSLNQCGAIHLQPLPPRRKAAPGKQRKDLADERFGPHQPERQKMALITDDGAPAYIAISKT